VSEHAHVSLESTVNVRTQRVHCADQVVMISPLFPVQSSKLYQNSSYTKATIN